MKFGRLTVIERAENKGHYVAWRCRCDCGTEKIVCGRALISGDTQSCGCFHKETAIKHGMSSTPIYNTWSNLKNRCLNPNSNHFKNYGGRGITVCDEWKDDFQAFYAYVSKLPHFGEDGYSLDRIDNNKGYEPDNVRWADRKTQNRNKRSNICVEYEGKKMTLADAAELSGIEHITLFYRYRAGDRDEYLFRPVKHS